MDFPGRVEYKFRRCSQECGHPVAEVFHLEELEHVGQNCEKKESLVLQRILHRKINDVRGARQRRQVDIAAKEVRVAMA